MTTDDNNEKGLPWPSRAEVQELIGEVSSLFARVDALVKKLDPLPAFLNEVEVVSDLVSDEARTHLLDPAKAILDGPLEDISGMMTASINNFQGLNQMLREAVPRHLLGSDQGSDADPNPCLTCLRNLLEDVWVLSDNVFDIVGMNRLNPSVKESHLRTIEHVPETVRALGLGAMCLYTPDILDLKSHVNLESLNQTDHRMSQVGDELGGMITAIVTLQILASALDAIPDMFPMTLTSTIGFAEVGLATGSLEIAGPTAMVTKPFQLVVEAIETGLTAWVDRH